MVGQVWTTPSEGGYMYSDELSDYLRMTAQALTKFRQLCDAKDGTQKGLNRGDKFYWDQYSNVGSQGRRLDERAAVPETGFTISQRSLTIYEAGNSVPYTGKLADLAKHDLIGIIDKTLKDDARKYFDIEAFLQFKSTVARVSPTAGNSTTAVDLLTNSTANTTNNVALGTGHIKAISDLMKEANIPAFAGDDYMGVTHVSTLRNFKNQLETIRQYTSLGLGHIFAGEVGRYENMRFIEQNFIPKGGANNATTYDPWSGTAQAWANGLSSWAFFCGGDTVTEAIAIPEEMRARLPGDYGRAKGLMWYYLGGFGISNPDSTNYRIVMWDSAT